MLRYCRSSEVRFSLVGLMIVVLIAAAANVPIAVSKIRSRTTPQGTRVVDCRGVEAARRGWVVRTPHEQDWSPPDRWMKWARLGFREYNVSASSTEEGRNGYSLELQHLGWPLPVLERRQMWWDWNNPALEGPEPDPRPRVLPLGFVLNPLFVGLPFWLLVFGLPFVFVIARRAWRARGGDCPWCGYEGVHDLTCPECGPDGAG